MWVGKFKIRHKDCWIIPKTIKYDIEEFGYTLNLYREGEAEYHSNISWIKGSENNKKKFFASIKRDKRIIKHQIKGNQLFTLVKQKSAVAHVFDQRLFFIKPIKTSKGYEYWELGSWDKRTLTKFYNKLTGFAEVKILKMQKEFPTVFIQHFISSLTEKQRNAIEYAHQSGYYKYPKKTSIKIMAENRKTPRTTFQNHLKKAESKLMNVIIGEN